MIKSEEEEQDYHGHFYHPRVNSGKYKEVWKSGYKEGIRVSPSIFSKEIQDLIIIDKVLDIYKVINMTREEAKELLPIIQAFAEGKTIEFKNCCGNWNNCGNVLIPGFPKDFRIKSESKYRPFKDTDECWQEMLKHQPFGWVRVLNRYKNILELRDSYNGIKLLENYWTYNELYECTTFVDGTPFGIKIE